MIPLSIINFVEHKTKKHAEDTQFLFSLQDTHIPPSDRCKYRCNKEPTKKFSRKHLLQFLETKAKEEKDWDEIKPYLKEIRGNIYTSTPFLD